MRIGPNDKTADDTYRTQVKKETKNAVLSSFEYATRLTRADIQQITHISLMSVSRAVSELLYCRMLNEQQDDAGKNNRTCKVLSCRDIASFLVIDVSSRCMQAYLLDTQLQVIRSQSYDYSDFFSYEDNLKLFLNRIAGSEMIELWHGRKIDPVVSYSDKRILHSRRTEAKKFARMIANMYTSLTPVPYLAVITPPFPDMRTYFPDILPPVYDSEWRICQIISDFLMSEPDGIYDFMRTIRVALPFALTNTTSYSDISSKRAILYLNSGQNTGTFPFCTYLYRTEKTSEWIALTGAHSLAGAYVRSPSAKNCSIHGLHTMLSEYLKVALPLLDPDTVLVDDYPAFIPLPTSDQQHTEIIRYCSSLPIAIHGAGILLRRIAWQKELGALDSHNNKS